jgi:protein gp37
MGEHSHIGWTEGTWNPWYGCTKISPGCKFCYMYREMARYGRDPFTVTRAKTTFTAPRHWKEPRLVFTCSWSDFFIESADEWRAEAWDVIRSTSHTYQVLTKRPWLIADRLPSFWDEIKHRVWLGVSVESPEYLWRAGTLREIPATVRFLSLEPLLAPMPYIPLTGIHWVIVGGESGSDRPCEVEWIIDIVDQCRVCDVPIFVKQDSGAHSGQKGRIPNEYWIKEFPKVVETLDHSDPREVAGV